MRSTRNLALTTALVVGLILAVSPRAAAAEARFDRLGREIWSPERGRTVYDQTGQAKSERLVGTPARREAPTPPTPPASVALKLPPLPTGLSRPVRQEWYWSVMGDGIGEAGLVAADLNGDGDLEVVAGSAAGTFGTNDSWYVLAYNGTDYAQTWANLPYTTQLESLRVAQADGDPALEVLAAVPHAILIYDGATFAFERVIHVLGTAVRGLTVVDVDGDGQTELVFCDASDLFIYDLATGSLERQAFGFGGHDLDVGQVDNDSDLEIAVANGSSAGYILNGSTGLVEWGVQSGFGSLVELGDLDGDGRDEVVAGFEWDSINVYNVEAQSLTYTVSVFDLAAITLANVAGGSALELIYGDGQWGSVHVLNGSTGVELWAVPNPEHGVTELAVGDTDGDGVPEILWGAGHTSTGPDYLYVADTVTHLREWQSVDLRGPFLGFDHGDTDGDHKPELVAAAMASDSFYGDGRYLVWDAVTRTLEHLGSDQGGTNWTGSWRVATGNADADPQREICLISSYFYDGMIYCYDGLTHLEEWHTMIPSGLSFRSLQMVDVDGDGTLEVVAGTGQEHTGAPGLYVYAFEAATGWLQWRTPDLGLSGFPSLSLLRVANVDGDPVPEVLVAKYGSTLTLLDGATGLPQLTTADLGITALDTADRNRDGVAEILIGTASGNLQVVDPATGAVVETVGSFSSAIDGLAVADITRDGKADYAFCQAERLFLKDGANGWLPWQSGFLGYQCGADDSLWVGDVDEDRAMEVVVNNGRGLVIFEVSLVPVFADGFESGNVCAWTFTKPAGSSCSP